MARQPSLVRAPDKYDRKKEDFFRRELESFLLEVLVFADAVSRGRNAEASASAKAGSYMPPVGQVSV